ncbi:MAG: hypothetical protein ACOY7U_02125 [Acidobacteriota bacterium]|nr:MAG: hypothetical protein KatS3mg007_1753 [Thermoanaerobaculum sp.]
MNLRQKAIAAGRRLLIGLLFWPAVVLFAGQMLGLLIGPVGDQIEYDGPTDPNALRRNFDYLSTVWTLCTPLGYTHLNLDADVYIGEASCGGSATLAAIREAFRRDLGLQESRALWVLEGPHWFAIAWPCSIFAKSCEPGETIFVIDGSRLVLVSGELICQKGRVAKRERCYQRALRKYLKKPLPLLRGLTCFEPRSEQNTHPQQKDSAHNTRGKRIGWIIRRYSFFAQDSSAIFMSLNSAEAA